MGTTTTASADLATALLGDSPNALELLGHPADSPGAAVVAGVVTCASRWGLAKTTVDDVAREAGVSRATVYRIFPGGKDELVNLATQAEVVSLLAGVHRRIDSADTLEAALVQGLHGGYCEIAEHPALSFMRDHEPAALRAFMSFERLSMLFETAADLIGPSLTRFLPKSTAHDVVVWASRLIVSYYLHPDTEDSPASLDFATDQVQTYFLPALAGELVIQETNR